VKSTRFTEAGYTSAGRFTGDQHKVMTTPVPPSTTGEGQEDVGVCRYRSGNTSPGSVSWTIAPKTAMRPRSAQAQTDERILKGDNRGYVAFGSTTTGLRFQY